MIGKGEPTIGSKPKTMLMLIVINTKIAEPKTVTKNFCKITSTTSANGYNSIYNYCIN